MNSKSHDQYSDEDPVGTSGRDFLLYVATSLETIGMVLVQEDEELQEHVIYYLSRNLLT